MVEAVTQKIQELIDATQYDAALLLLQSEEDDFSNLQRIICYMGLKEYAKVIADGEKILGNESNKYYYDVLSLYVVALIQSAKEDEAIAVLETELAVPYIPKEFEVFFQETYNKLVKQKQANKTERSPYDLYSDDQINELLLTASNFETLALAIYQTHNRNIRKFTAALEVVLMNQEIPTYLKTIILELLHEQNVNEEFEYHTHEFQMRIEPTSLTPLFEQASYQAVRQTLQNKVGQENVSLAQVCFDLTSTVFASVYPLEISEDEYDCYAAAIYQYASEIMGIQTNKTAILQLFNVPEKMLDIYHQKVQKLSKIDE